MYPSPTQNRRAPLALQPYFFHSEVFVESTKDDISCLLSAFEDACQKQIPSQPFALFKVLWVQNGWDMIHLKVLDPRGREAFLLTIMRLLLDNVLCDDTALWRVGALFALYTFYSSQPSSSLASLHVQKQMPICIDDFRTLVALPSSVEPPLVHYALYMLRTLLDQHAFHILPPSTTHPHNPRHLPASRLALEPAEQPGKGTAKKRRGRPSRRDKQARAGGALAALSAGVDELDASTVDEAPPPSGAYVAAKEALLEDAPAEALARAERKTIERMRKLATKGGDAPERGLLLKAEDAAKEPAGLLHLVQNAPQA